MIPLVPPVLLAVQVPTQTPTQTVVPTNDPLPSGIATLEKAGDWAGLADRFETLSPQERGLLIDLWMRSLKKAERWQRLVQVSEAVLAQVDAKAGGPALSPARLYRAQGISQLGRHADAYAAWSQIGTLGASYGFVNAAQEARIMGTWDDLLNQSEAMLQKQPKDAQALGWKGEAMAKLGAFTEAEPVLREALALDPRQPYSWSNLGQCLNERKAWAESLAACDKALALEPVLMEAHYNRGRALFELKRYKEAREDFRIALASKPDDAVLAENLRQAERYANPTGINK